VNKRFDFNVSNYEDAVSWDVMPCGSCKNWHFTRSSGTLVLTRATWHHIPEDGILQCPTQLASFLLLGLYSTESAECRANTTSNLWACPIRYYPVPLSCQRQPRTKDTRCLQDPLWVWQGLHWAYRLFHGHQVKGASTAYPTGTSRHIGHSWTQYRPDTLHSITQYLHHCHKNQMHGQHC
jgi:hypothetical protein